MEKITERARGRWKDIFQSLGLSAKLLDGKHHPCPLCNAGTDRFRFTNYDGSGGYICSRCGNGSGFDLLMAVKGWDFKFAAAEVDKVIGGCRSDRIKTVSESDKRRAMNEVWSNSISIKSGDPVSAYLSRRCGIAEFPTTLRYAPTLRYYGSADCFPAMLAKITAPDGSPSSIHRTYLTANGDKAPVEAPRRMMAGTIARGSAVRLGAPAEEMGIGEGIETCLSASALFGLPVWAALNAELMKAWTPPEGTKRVIVCGDNDDSFTGQAAAFSLARRLDAEGIEVEVRIPDKISTDWNDVHMATRERA